MQVLNFCEKTKITVEFPIKILYNIVNIIKMEDDKHGLYGKL